MLTVTAKAHASAKRIAVAHTHVVGRDSERSRGAGLHAAAELRLQRISRHSCGIRSQTCERTDRWRERTGSGDVLEGDFQAAARRRVPDIIDGQSIRRTMRTQRSAGLRSPSRDEAAASGAGGETVDELAIVVDGVHRVGGEVVIEAHRDVNDGARRHACDPQLMRNALGRGTNRWEAQSGKSSQYSRPSKHTRLCARCTCRRCRSSSPSMGLQLRCTRQDSLHSSHKRTVLRAASGAAVAAETAGRGASVGRA